MAKDKEKSIIEEALYDASLLRESMNKNTKEILRSVAKEEIEGLVNESFGEDEEEDIDLDMDNGAEETEVDTDVDAGLEVDVEAGEEAGEALDFEAGSEEGSADYEDTEGMASEDDYEFDLTTASDEEVIAVFKKLQDNDEFEIVNDKEVHITDPESGNEYHVKLGNETPGAEETEALAPAGEFDLDSEAGEETGDEVDYEVELDTDDFGGEEETEEETFGAEEAGEEETEDEEEITEDIVRGQGHDTHVGGGSLPSGDIEGQKAEKDSDTGDNLTGGFDDDAVSHANAEGPMVMEDEEEILDEEEELDEQIPQGRAQAERVPAQADNGAPVGPGAKGHVSEAQYNKLLKAYKAMVQENKEFKGALKEFRKMVNEVALFNTNLTYATRLFTENTTTKEEKREILKRFDNEATNVKESKKVFKTIQEGLNKRTPLAESVGKKIETEAKTSGKSQINESTAYEDASTKRMRELMAKMSGR
jgi:hypothetical protein